VTAREREAVGEGDGRDGGPRAVDQEFQQLAGEERAEGRGDQRRRVAAPATQQQRESDGRRHDERGRQVAQPRRDGHAGRRGEANEMALDAGGGPTQVYVEDCQVCCRAWQVRVRYLPDGGADVTVEAV